MKKLAILTAAMLAVVGVAYATGPDVDNRTPVNPYGVKPDGTKAQFRMTDAGEALVSGTVVVEGPVVVASADGGIPEVVLGEMLGTETNRLATTATATAGGLTGAVTVPDSTDVPVPATALENRRGVTVQNLGPSAIYCCLQTGCTTATGMRVLPGGSMYRGVGPSVGIFCISAGGDADVRVEEVR